MAKNDPISSYLTKMNKALKEGTATEHTHRPALKAFVETIAAGQNQDVTATNELPCQEIRDIYHI